MKHVQKSNLAAATFIIGLFISFSVGAASSDGGPCGKAFGAAGIDSPEQRARRRIALDAQDAEMAGDLKKAIRIMEGLVKASPQDPLARTQLAVLYRKVGNRDLAFEQFSEALKIEGPRARIFIPMAQLKMADGKRLEARAILEQAVEIIPNDEYLLAIYTQVLLISDSPKQALDSANRLLEIEPDSGMAKGLKIQALMQNPNGLDEAYGIAVHLEDDFFRRFYTGTILIAKGEYQRADDVFAQMPQTKRSVLWKRADLNFRSGNMIAARGFLNRLLTGASLSADLWPVLGLLKIESLGSFDRSPLLDAIFHTTDFKERARLAKMADLLDWSFISANTDKEYTERSFENPFWSSLNTVRRRPVDGQTRRSTF